MPQPAATSGGPCPRKQMFLKASAAAVLVLFASIRLSSLNNYVSSTLEHTSDEPAQPVRLSLGQRARRS